LAGGTSTNAGWTVGAGLEFAIAGHWSAKAEYLYVDLGKFNCGASCAAGVTSDNVSFTTSLVRAGVNYRF
jgi:outer membrane immunogenic protein